MIQKYIYAIIVYRRWEIQECGSDKTMGVVLLLFELPLELALGLFALFAMLSEFRFESFHGSHDSVEGILRKHVLCLFP